MQLKWLDDFIALARERSFTRAAELRHVTHPAFGRRIRALEAWAGTPLVEPGSAPLRLTAAGQAFLETAEQTARELAASQHELRALAGRHARTVTLATGRTLARTLVADWLPRLAPLLGDAGTLRIHTGSLAETVQWLQDGAADFALLYHHPALTIPLDARQFSHRTLAQDRLVPVSRADANGAPLHALRMCAAPVPHVAHARTLALGRLLEDHLTRHPAAPPLRRLLECDSPDATHEYVLRGLGVAWLPWSLVQGDCQGGRLARAGDAALDVVFDVRLYRPKRRLGPLAEILWTAMTSD
ncbi:DNA-binding transcriptional regulator, LysR family [Oryzisolibacter propanilivorax]|uniref:DNA-binding transcriptional regulator, LysR family n=1 Tax=Oryzisolibacter propanilivorax TaxID=1527607 RepID=A0A1G9QB66_9BURK|nr:LysR substrate-binding domain-containing protein [Oryzisolibacter propanilivorax]SDM08183.1 DNA-binding transcriptional regulator, LysR family [Oryzisolibacter propanilivorax]